MHRSKTVSGVVLVALLAGACGGGSPGQDAAGDAIAVELAGSLSPEEAAAAAEGVNAFGFDLHRAVAEPGEKAVTSPLSASVLLALAAGAGGLPPRRWSRCSVSRAPGTPVMRRYWPTSRAKRCDVGTRQHAVGGGWLPVRARLRHLRPGHVRGDAS
jgi:hypothetical protein